MKIKLNVAALATITLAGTITMPCFASDAPEINVATLESYRTNIANHQGDLLSISKSTSSVDDRDDLLKLVDVAMAIRPLIIDLEELLDIRPLMQNDADKQVLARSISTTSAQHAIFIGICIEKVNNNMANLKSPAGATEAGKLKDDLHGLQQLLEMEAWKLKR